jgi:hypothetical protein
MCYFIKRWYKIPFNLVLIFVSFFIRKQNTGQNVATIAVSNVTKPV